MAKITTTKKPSKRAPYSARLNRAVRLQDIPVLIIHRKHQNIAVGKENIYFCLEEYAAGSYFELTTNAPDAFRLHTAKAVFDTYVEALHHIDLLLYAFKRWEKKQRQREKKQRQLEKIKSQLEKIKK